MTIDVSSLSVEKALSMAILAEKEAAGLYEKLKGMVNNFVLKDKLDFLISEEAIHQKILESLFASLFPEEEPDAEKSLIPRLKITAEEENSVLEILEQAMEAEKIFEDFYERLAEETTEKSAQEILMYLSSMEHSHYALLKGEYDLSLNDEQYFERGDFMYDMVHIGP
jgi:rubrerythrin